MEERKRGNDKMHDQLYLRGKCSNNVCNKWVKYKTVDGVMRRNTQIEKSKVLPTE